MRESTSWLASRTWDPTLFTGRGLFRFERFLEIEKWFWIADGSLDECNCLWVLKKSVIGMFLGCHDRGSRVLSSHFS